MEPQAIPSIQFQNRAAFLRDRDNFLEQASQEIEYLLHHFEKLHATPDGPEQLLELAKTLVGHLKEARYFGFRGLGGDPTNPPDFITPYELSAVDHISVMYHAAISVMRYLRHECLVRQYQREHPIKDEYLRDYIHNVESSDRTLILLLLKTMKERMDIYRTYQQQTQHSKSAGK
ncbi:MAG: hypothetical protein D6675_10505 [Gemmatimonadetes bacterium]|nr:MAG: hypothetical protein D6675_10505 [Gemmatimonadota bacterium]